MTAVHVRTLNKKVSYLSMGGVYFKSVQPRIFPMRVLVVYKGLAERLKARLPDDIEVIYPEIGTDEELVELARDVEVIVSTRLSAVVAENAPMLKLLQKTGASIFLNATFLYCQPKFRLTTPPFFLLRLLRDPSQ